MDELALTGPLGSGYSMVLTADIGAIYELGLAGKKDLSEALKWYEKIGDYQDAQSRYILLSRLGR